MKTQPMEIFCVTKKRNSCRITIGKSRLITIFGGQFPFLSLHGSILYFDLESLPGPQVDGVLKGTFLSF